MHLPACSSRFPHTPQVERFLSGRLTREDARGVGNASPPTRLIGETGRYPSLWKLPKAVDFASSNPLQPTFVSMAATIGGLIAHAYAEGVKRRKYKQRLSPPATTSGQQ
ncbi:hypothetical protein GJ496_006796 [Pomphorhynchus laevis]|nr:hypothetical protein GJ496_006796 [Pomphorhynchus laevis]